ncbi:hypothetical protein JL720_3508 [Aureococcus anophagefferens]|nr:hypothetical protein JL720_3508 [Aureococcus anophagefferens]
MRLLRRQLKSIWTGLDRRALAKDVATAGALGCVGDFICQGAVEQRETIDWRRFVEGSSAHALGCSLADNVHDGSLMIPSYFVGVGLMQGDALDATLGNLRREWLASYLAGCSFWIPVMWLNFRVVPAPYRVRVMAVSNTCWSVIIDFLAHRSRGDVT